MGFVGHVTQLEQSRCFIASADMTCIDCHDPHMTHSQKREAATQQVHCFKCHEPQSCDADFDHRQALNGDDCVACHMPRIDSVLTHVAVTNHRIAVYPLYDHLDVTDESLKGYKGHSSVEAVSLDSDGLPRPVALLDAAPPGSPQRALNEAMAVGIYMIRHQSAFNTPAALAKAIERLRIAVSRHPDRRDDANLILAQLQTALVRTKGGDVLDDEVRNLLATAAELFQQCERSTGLNALQRAEASATLAEIDYRTISTKAHGCGTKQWLKAAEMPATGTISVCAWGK